MVRKPNNSALLGLGSVAQTVAQSVSEEHMPYTEKRGSTYWFRRRAPEPLRPETNMFLGDQPVLVGRNGYVRFSLRTKDHREAGKLARKYSHLLDQAAERIAQALQRAAEPAPRDIAAEPPAQPTADEIKYAADVMYAQLLAADEQTLALSFAAALSGDSDVREPDRFIWTSADLPPLTLAGQIELLKRLRQVVPFYLFTATGKVAQAITAEYLPFADAFRRYVAALERRRAAEIVPTPPMPQSETIWSWQDAFDYYIRQRPSFAESSKKNYSLAWKSLEACAKCSSPAKLALEDVVRWKDEVLSKLHQQTAKTRLTFAGAIWRASRINGRIPRATLDPFDGVRVVQNQNLGSKRRAYTHAELEALFSAPPVTTIRSVSMQAGYWLPLLALYHGARLNELGGLEVRDIEDWNGSLVLHIRENEIRPRLKGRKKSERSFPVHPKLLELGFATYVQAARQAKVKALFPSFARSATFGEAYVEYAQKQLNPAQGELVGMHNFRHVWETARRTARLDTSASNYITGRRIDAGSAALYGGPAGLETLANELSKISYPLKFKAAPSVTASELRAQAKQCAVAVKVKS